MIDFLQLMAAPFAACVILTAIHVYLGLHVLEREVIFVDLALAQTAAFGATVGFLFGLDLHSTGSYFVALSCTLIGAALFALTRFRKPVVPQEAIIGIVYVVTASAAILVLGRTPDGSEELKSLLVGHLLFVEWNEVIKITCIYALVGGLHYAIRRPLLLISCSPEQAFARGMPVRAWDFLFYVTFGFVVTSSVELAGVLLVFSFLIVPIVCGILMAQSVRGRLVTGWLVGVLTSILGLTISYSLDLPTGATVVCAFGAALILCALIRFTRRGERIRSS